MKSICALIVAQSLLSNAEARLTKGQQSRNTFRDLKEKDVKTNAKESTYAPTDGPTYAPTDRLTDEKVPTYAPTDENVPTYAPTDEKAPTYAPNDGLTDELNDEQVPTYMPTKQEPTYMPTDEVQSVNERRGVPCRIRFEKRRGLQGSEPVPTYMPTYLPTYMPTGTPSGTPTATPTAFPSYVPTYMPTDELTGRPTGGIVNEDFADPREFFFICDLV